MHDIASRWHRPKQETIRRVKDITMSTKLVIDNDTIRVALLEEYADDDFRPVVDSEGKPKLAYDGKPVYRVKAVIWFLDPDTGRWTVDDNASLRLVEKPVNAPVMTQFKLSGKVVVSPYTNDSGKYTQVRYSITAESLSAAKQ